MARSTKTGKKLNYNIKIIFIDLWSKHALWTFNCSENVYLLSVWPVFIGTAMVYNRIFDPYINHMGGYQVRITILWLARNSMVNVVPPHSLV